MLHSKPATLLLNKPVPPTASPLAVLFYPRRNAMINNIIELARSHSSRDLPHYTDIVSKAFDDIQPVFVDPKYVDFFWHCLTSVPGWLPSIMLGNAQAESDGTAKLLQLWSDVNFDDGIEEQILHHATDEARHSRIFVKLIEETFPGVMEQNFRDQYIRSLTKVKKDELAKSDSSISDIRLIDHLVQMNMGEIRTRIHIELLAPALTAFAPDNAKEEVSKMSNGLGHDEVAHIGYIAAILEDLCINGDKERVTELYRTRLHDFHQFTVEQTKRAVQDYGNGAFVELLS
jgi:hypothetical protein